MLLKLLKSKIHKATVTETKLHYQGSIAVDSELMDAVGLLPYESVMVADVDNGNRLETYIIPAPAGSRQVVILGPAARLVEPKDTIIILSFALFTPEEAKSHKPKVIVLDGKNDIVQRK